MKVHSAWAVAAAILLSKRRALHYGELTKLVVETNLTTLAEKGYTPAQTLGVILRTHKIEGKKLFKAYGRGCYDLRDRAFAVTLDEVRAVRDELTSRGLP